MLLLLPDIYKLACKAEIKLLSLSLSLSQITKYIDGILVLPQVAALSPNLPEGSGFVSLQVLLASRTSVDTISVM